MNMSDLKADSKLDDADALAVGLNAAYPKNIQELTEYVSYPKTAKVYES